MRDLNKELEKHDHWQSGEVKDWYRRQLDELQRRRLDAARPADKPAEPRNDEVLKSIESKIEGMRGSVLKDVSGIMLRLEEFDEAMREERALRLKIEDRLKNIEKNLAPKDETKDKDGKDKDGKDKDKAKEEAPRDADPRDKDAGPKDKDSKDKDSKDASGFPKTRVAQVSISQEGVPINKALIVVYVPVEAKLYLNNQPTLAKGTQRIFVTPVLEPSGTYTYTFRMEVYQNGAFRTQTQVVTFQPGRRVNVVFGPSSEVRVAGAQK